MGISGTCKSPAKHYLTRLLPFADSLQVCGDCLEASDGVINSDNFRFDHLPEEILHYLGYKDGNASGSQKHLLL